ncbi:hypothetical protein IW261DRAFT_1562218 [Armillaria novae-zelandiae]|uniref:Uncharacterized protein n=1 Tax=Armillaria novae-zelandiae TaxID=153914 RepID=A0AA39PFR9_9AGAR|nr:hypothetical protein IW261DRAFT_1562218 [Armillaria novae-zelandiae]
MIDLEPVEWMMDVVRGVRSMIVTVVDDVCLSGEEYNFLVAKALKCGVAINLIPELCLTQYAAEVVATSAPLSFGGSLLVPRH